ncbi:MAG: hypothetical protein HY460_00440 [Parcubacteria group bacterium]|nr:hypothetical protein [Parcubacteria group bacterium]
MLYCSFCGNSQTQVKRLVQGRRAETHICNECIWGCWEMVLEPNCVPARFKGAALTARKIILQDSLEEIEQDIFRLNAERDNILHELESLQAKSPE